MKLVSHFSPKTCRFFSPKKGVPFSFSLKPVASLSAEDAQDQ